jgi:hypothetical protein
MSSEEISTDRRCPKCGATFKAGDKDCWLCREETAIRAGPPARTAPPVDLAERIKMGEPLQDMSSHVFFGVLAIVLGAGLALLLMAPGILIVLLVLATPAMMRTAYWYWHKKDRQEPLTLVAGLGVFLSTLGLAFMIGVAASIAFCATCTVVFLGGAALSNSLNEWLFQLSIAVGIVPAVFAGFVVFWSQWKRKN